MLQLQLPNGCWCSKPTIFPKNWNKAGASLKKDWKIQYYFRDPNFLDRYPNGKYCPVKAHVNDYDTLEKRRDAIKLLLDEQIRMLTIHGWNPILKKIVPPVQFEGECNPDTPFIEALRVAQKSVSVGKYTKRDLVDIIARVEKSAIKFHLHSLPISMVSRRYIKIILNDIGDSAHKFNKYRTHLMILFNELFEMEATEHDPISRIRKRKTVKKIRSTLSAEERKLVNDHLFKNHYTFWRFMQIFFHSGCRESEMMLVKYEDVDIQKQRFKVTVAKGKQYREEWRTIKDIILPLWKEVLSRAQSGQFLFCRLLLPGNRSIEAQQIGKRWRKYVKAPKPEGLGIKSDFYALKHSNLDEIAEILSVQDASKAAGHASIEITKNHYLIGEKEREHQRLKAIRNDFV